MALPKKQLHLFVSDELIAQIDDWRRKQPMIPSRSAAARYIFEKGLRIVEQEPKKGRR